MQKHVSLEDLQEQLQGIEVMLEELKAMMAKASLPSHCFHTYSCGCCTIIGCTRCPAHVGIQDMRRPERP